MAFVEVLLIALGLAMDAFAVSLGAGPRDVADVPAPCFPWENSLKAVVQVKGA